MTPPNPRKNPQKTERFGSLEPRESIHRKNAMKSLFCNKLWPKDDVPVYSLSKSILAEMNIFIHQGRQTGSPPPSEPPKTALWEDRTLRRSLGNRFRARVVRLPAFADKRRPAARMLRLSADGGQADGPSPPTRRPIGLPDRQPGSGRPAHSQTNWAPNGELGPAHQVA